MLSIIKLGGSVITDKASDMPKPNMMAIEQVCRAIAEAYAQMAVNSERLIIIHGAGSYGHPIVKRTGIGQGIQSNKQLLSLAETQLLQNELNTIVVRELIENGVPAFPVQASASAMMKSGKLVSMDTGAIKGLLDSGMVPVLYGVPAYDENQKCSILSGDVIVTYLASELKAKRVVHASTVDGVCTSDPAADEKAQLIATVDSNNLVDVMNILRQRPDSDVADVTSGMLGKLSELVSASRLGIDCLIVNALKPDRIKRALLGLEVEGTRITL